MKILGKTFATKKDEIAYLIKHKEEILQFKRAAVKHTDCHIFLPDNKTANIFKVLGKSVHEEEDDDKVIKRSIVINTYNWLDSHGDVHLDGIFTKSIDERGDQVKHLHDHINNVGAKVGEPTKVHEMSIPWGDLGVDKAGNTTSLVFDTDIIKAYNEGIFEQYKRGKIDQHSVGMFYVKIDFAANDADFPTEHKVWAEVIDRVGNKEAAEAQGYFWAVREAKVVEGSAVIQGSNTLTPTLEAKDIEPLGDTQTKTKPPQSTSSNIYTYY